MRVNVSRGIEDVVFNIKFGRQLDSKLQSTTICSKCKNIGHGSDRCPIQRCFNCRGYGHTQHICGSKTTSATDSSDRFKNFRKRTAGGKTEECTETGTAAVVEKQKLTWKRGVRLQNSSDRNSNWRINKSSDSPISPPTK